MAARVRYALWFAEDQSQDAAGVIYPRDDDAAAALGVWSAALRDAKAPGLSPRDAVTGLLGTKKGRGSVVGSELSRIDDLSTIVERFRPEVVASREPCERSSDESV